MFDDMPPAFEGIRLPPHSIEAEQSVLGGLLLVNSAYDRIMDVVSELEFYRSDHRVIFQLTAKLIEANQPADVLTLANSLKEAGKLAEVGGFEYLQSLVQGTPSARNIRQYAEIVHEKAIQRALMAAGDTIVSMAVSPQGKTADRLLDESQAILMELGKGKVSDAVSTGELLPSFEDVLRRRQVKEIVGVSTHFIDIDRMTNGFQRGNLIVIAGRPSMGKSSLAFQIAEQVTVTGGKALCFSMEMSTQEFMDRAVSRVGAVKLKDILTGAAHGAPGVTKAMEKLATMQLYIDDSAGLSVNQIRARSRTMKRKFGGLDLIVIDYLQLMPGTGDTRNAQIEDITRGLKSLAKELDVPVIVLSQLNRKCEERTDKRPMMSDLRESGAIEQDADIIMFVYRQEQYTPDDPAWKNIAEIIFAKNRQGETGIVPMVFFGEYTAFKDFKGDMPERSKPTNQRRDLT